MHPHDLNALVSYVDTNAAATYQDWKTPGVTSASCRACVFGAETAAQWAPLIEDAAGQLVGLNVGGCIAVATNNVSCGKAYQNLFDCRFEACAACPSGGTPLQACLETASKPGNACATAVQNVGTICGAGIDAAEGACSPVGTKFVFEGPIKAQCIAGVP